MKKAFLLAAVVAALAAPVSALAGQTGFNRPSPAGQTGFN